MRRYFVWICILMVFWSGCQVSEREDSMESEESIEAPALTEEEALFLTDGYLPDFDMQNQFSIYKDAARVGDTIYFKFGANMYYYDMNTGITVPLCGKAECNHTSGSCNAYFWDLCGFCYYNQKIYWVEWENDHYYLASMNLDGSQHERVQEMPEPFVFNEFASNMRIHRGYVYIGEELAGVKDGKPYNHLVISRVKVGAGESEPGGLSGQGGAGRRGSRV